MLKTRLIPVLLLQNGQLVRAETFDTYQVLGNPVYEVQRYNEWNVDELIYLDITKKGSYVQRAVDQKENHATDPLAILELVSKTCFMPLTWGGRIRSVDDMRERFKRGADKITINTGAIEEPELIARGAEFFGNQAIVVSIDVRRHPDDTLEVFADGGQVPTGMCPETWAQEVEQRGAGEILLTSIDRDGTGDGYDLDLISRVSSVTSIPVIACGGVGRYEDYAEAIRAGASAAAAANIWHFKELSDRNGKRALAKAGVNVRL